MEWPFGAEEREAIILAWDSQRVTQGQQVRRFESEFLHVYGPPKGYGAAMTNSGSSALLLAASLLRQALQKENDHRNEVIFPSVCWSTTVAPFIQQGFRPVFVDVGPDYCIDPKLADRAVTDRTAAIVPVHLLGNPCDMGHLNRVASRFGLRVINDACEALAASWAGSPIGKVGFATAWSFYYSHHLSTIEGGMLTYPEEFHEVKAWREHGWTRQYPEDARKELADKFGLDPTWTFDKLGWNVRSTDLNAAIGLAQFPKVAANKAARKRIAAELDRRVKHDYLVPNTVPALADPNPFSYPVMLADHSPVRRAQLAQCLQEAGIETRPVMTGNITRQPWYVRHPGAYNVSGGNMPQADRVHERALLVPCHPGLNGDDVKHIADTITGFLDQETSHP